MRCSQGANGRRRSKRSSERTAARNASWATSSAAAASWTTSHAARCARGQWRRNSSSIAADDPPCAARTSARSDAGRRARLTPESAAGSAASRVSATPLHSQTPEDHGGDRLTHGGHTAPGAPEVPLGGSLHSAAVAHCAERGENDMTPNPFIKQYLMTAG